MNNKGFTLAELLAIIVILAVIMIVAAPNVTKQIQKKEQTDVNILNQKIENAAKIYVAKYYSDKVIGNEIGNELDPIEFTLNDLQQDGLINLTKNSSCDNDLDKEIHVNFNNNKVNFDFGNIECYK